MRSAQPNEPSPGHRHRRQRHQSSAVDTVSGQMLATRYRVATPRPSRPESVYRLVGTIRDHFGWSGPVGCAFPGVVRDGKTLTAANVHKSWIGTDAAADFKGIFGGRVVVLNDADAAGLAEVRFGPGQRDGVVIVLTLGTGIGSAIFVDRRLMPNTELGHLRVDGREAERRASARGRRCATNLIVRGGARGYGLFFRSLRHFFGRTCSLSVVASARISLSTAAASISERRCYRPRC